MADIVGPRGATQRDDLWLDSPAIAAATGWRLEPEGLCRGDVCLLVPDELRRGDLVDVVALWRRLDWPVIESGGAVYLGEDAATKADTMAGETAPDFTLEDLEGRTHSLSDHRGKKVLISSWAPW